MRDSASGFRTQAECTARNGEDEFLLSLNVTSDGIVIDGHAHLEIARLQGRTTVECIEMEHFF